MRVCFIHRNMPAQYRHLIAALPERGDHVQGIDTDAVRPDPQALIVVIGGDEVGYGRRLPAGDSYRQRLTRELGDRIDASRILFNGKLPCAQYLRLLQVSAVHADLTYPFVLSRSLLEALSAGCCVVASRTPPVEEVLQDGVNGLLADGPRRRRSVARGGPGHRGRALRPAPRLPAGGSGAAGPAGGAGGPRDPEAGDLAEPCRPRRAWRPRWSPCIACRLERAAGRK